jgi:hypothetical protein
VILSYPYVKFPSNLPGVVTRSTLSSVHIRLDGEARDQRYSLWRGCWRSQFGYQVRLCREPQLSH